LAHSATLDQSGVPPRRTTRLRRWGNRGFPRPERRDRRSSAERRYKKLAPPSRCCSALTGPFIAWLLSPTGKVSVGISGRIKNQGHHDRAGDIFDGVRVEHCSASCPTQMGNRSLAHCEPPRTSLRQTLGQGLAVHPGRPGRVPGAVVVRIRVRPRVRACDETYLRDLRESASVGNCGRSPWVTLVLVVFAPVAILVLTCLYRSHKPLARLSGADQGLPWRQVAVSVDHGAPFSDGTTTEPRSVHHL
jgi:hypothetical protein